MKRITVLVKKCDECPKHVHDPGDGESPWTFDYCGRGRELGWTFSDCALRDFPNIPEWCPEPNV